jgi:hypothetical protein
MISHVPGPMDRLAARMRDRFERWLDGICADPPAPPDRGPQPVVHAVQPPLRGVPALIAKALEGGTVSGLSQREIARRFNTSKTSVQRAQRMVREYAEA